MKLSSIKNPCLFILLFYNCLSAQYKVDTLDLSEYPNRIILSQKINETSGVEFYNNYLYTFNDSGGKPEIYKVNPENGEIQQIIKIKNAKNKDWEEITRKNDTLFIGDFGNNLGIRKDLTIYSVILPKESEKQETKELKAQVIHSYYFTFEDQTDFENKGYSITDFDCEAMVYHNQKLHLFSKQWGSNQTAHYELDLTKKDISQVVKKIEIFPTDCLITGADLFNDELYLIGYDRNGIAYIWKFTDFSEGKFFNGKAQKTILGLTAAIGQTEGISVTKDKIYITGEEMNYSLFHTPPSLYILDKNDL